MTFSDSSSSTLVVIGGDKCILVPTCRVHSIRCIGGRRIRDIAAILVRVVYLEKGKAEESKKTITHILYLVRVMLNKIQAHS